MIHVNAIPFKDGFIPHTSPERLKQINEEIIGFLVTIINDLPRIELSRGNPQIGYYLFDPFNVDKYINKNFINRPWGGGEYKFKNDDF